METKSTSIYRVLVKSAQMPHSCKGRYVRVGLVEMNSADLPDPKMLSARSLGVRRVVVTYERCHFGKTARCASARAIAACRELAAELEATGASHD